MDCKEIYTQRIAELRAQAEDEFPLPQKRDDPGFRAFVSFVGSVPAKFKADGPPEHKLFGLWFASKTFRTHWNNATRETPKHLAWVCFMHRLGRNQTFWVVLAWMQHHGRYTTSGEMTCLL